MMHKVPTRSFRPDTTSAMAGAIFMSNTETREQCFQASIFGLPLEYESFVNNVKKGMPLFLFDHNLRKLYGVFEAASDGGLNINKSAFRSIQHSYPAQVRINIIWKCRPLSEDEFFPAIEENYYLPRKFYFDLSYDQIVWLYELFDDRKVERRIQNESLETKNSSKGTPDKGRLTPNVLHSNDQSQLLIPDISALVRKYSTPTSVHTVVPTIVEVHPNMSMPLGTRKFGAQIAPIHSHHDKTKLPCQRDLFQAASITDGVSTQVPAPYSTRHQQLVGSRSYPLPHDYPHKILSSGRITQDATEGAKYGANQSYPSSHGYIHSSLISSGYVTQNPAYGDRNHVSSTSTLYAPSYPHLSLANPQGNVDYQEHCDVCIRQCHFGANGKMYAYECQRFSEGKSLPPAKLSQQGTPAYPEVPEYEENTVSTIEQQRKCSTDYIPIPEGFENDRMKHGIHSNASDSSDLDNDIGVDMSDPRHTKHAIGAERNTNCPQRSVFSRLSLSQQLPSQEASGPTLNQLVSSLSQKTEQWSNKNRPITDGIGKYLIREQATDRPCSYSELNMSSQLELEAEAGESTEPLPPLLNFKRRSEARKVDTYLGKENSGKVKRRKLVRPSFGENNASSSAGKEVEGNCTQEMKHNHLEVSGDHFDIDLNIPVSVDSDLAKEDNSIAVYPSVLIKIQTEKLSQVDANEPNCSNDMEAVKEQDSSFDNGAPAKMISIDFNVAELNTMDESKLRTILGQTSSLLKVLGKLTSGKSNNPEEARSSICSVDSKHGSEL